MKTSKSFKHILATLALLLFAVTGLGADKTISQLSSTNSVGNGHVLVVEVITGGATNTAQISVTNFLFAARGLASLAQTTITNGFATVQYVQTATNGFVGASITNGLATTNYVNTATNGHVGITITNGLASIALVTTTSNGIVSLIGGGAATNAVLLLNGNATNLNVWASTIDSLPLQGHQILGARTNVFSITDSNNVPKFVVGSNFWVGVLTNRPQAPLHVLSPTTAPAMILETSLGDNQIFVIKGPGGTNLFTFANDGDIGGRLSINDQAGIPTTFFGHGVDSYIDRNMTGHGLAIGTNNAMGFDLAVAGNVYIQDGILFAGNSTNNGTMRQVGAVTFPNLATNLILYLNAGGAVSVYNLAPANILARDIIVSQSTPIGATNSIDFSTNIHQYYSVVGDTAFKMAAASSNTVGRGELTLYNLTPTNCALYYPSASRLDTGSLPPATLASNSFTTLVFRWQKGESHVATMESQGLTVQSNGTDIGTSQRLNFVGASVVNTAGTNTVTITGGGGGSLATNANQFGASTTLTIKESPAITNLLAKARTTNDAFQIFDNNGNLQFFFASNGIPHIPSTSTDFHFDGLAGVFFVGAEAALTLSDTNALIHGALTADRITVESNITERIITGAPMSNGTNWIVDLAYKNFNVASSAITNGIFIIHSTNRPPAGCALGSTWKIDTGNTNRHLYIPSPWQGNVVGTNTATASYLLPSNSVAFITWKAFGTTEGDIYYNFPATTP